MSGQAHFHFGVSADCSISLGISSSRLLHLLLPHFVIIIIVIIINIITVVVVVLVISVVEMLLPQIFPDLLLKNRISPPVFLPSYSLESLY